MSNEFAANIQHLDDTETPTLGVTHKWRSPSTARSVSHRVRRDVSARVPATFLRTTASEQLRRPSCRTT